MTPSDKPRFAELVTTLAANFNIEADEPRFHGYAIALDDLPIQAIERAVRQAIRYSKFMPSGAELRELAGDLPPKARAALAFDSAIKAVASVGQYASVRFEDAATNAVIRSMGGWVKFCEWPDGEEVWRRKEFERLYEIVCKAGVKDEPGHLLGVCEQNNRASGFEGASEVRLIGSSLPALPGQSVRHVEQSSETRRLVAATSAALKTV